MATAAPAHQHQNGANNQQDTGESDPRREREIQQLETQKKAIIDKIVGYNRRTYYELGAAGESERDTLMNALSSDLMSVNAWELDEHSLAEHRRKIQEWSDTSWTEKNQAAAEKLVGKLHTMLSKAVSDKSISASSKEKWLSRFRNPGATYKQKEKYVEETLPKMLQAAKSVAASRRQVLKSSHVKRLDPATVPALAVLLDESRFLNLHYDEKVATIKAVKSSEAAVNTGHEAEYKRAATLLSGAVSAGALSSGKMAEWLHSIFETGRTGKDIQQIVQSTLPGYVRNWNDARQDYNRIQAEFKRYGTPADLDTVSSRGFQQLGYPEKLQWNSAAKVKLTQHKKQQDGALSDLKEAIRTEDWEAGQSMIDAMESGSLTSGQKQTVRQLATVVTAGLAARTIASEDSSNDIGEDMTKALERIKAKSPSVYNMAVEAANAGPKAFAAFSTLMYNRVWCHENHYLDGDKEAELREDAFDQTEEVVREGHHDQYENNTIDGFGSAAVRSHANEEIAPQVIHISGNSSSHSALAAKCEQQQGNELFKYWTTLVPDGVDYPTHASIVKNDLWVVKSGLRQGHKPLSDAEMNASQTAGEAHN